MQVGSVDRDYWLQAKYLPNAKRITVKTGDKANASGRGGFGRGGGTLGASFAGGDSDALDSFREAGNYKPVQTEINLQRLPVEEILAHADSIKESDIVNFGEGDSIKVVLQIEGNPGVEKQLYNLIESRMKAGGVTIDNSSDYVLNVSYRVGETVERKYNIIGFGAAGRTRNISFVPKTCSASLRFQGEVIWANSATAKLGYPSDEEHLNQMLAEAKKVSVRSLLDFKYPASMRVLKPSRKKTFEWR